MTSDLLYKGHLIIKMLLGVIEMLNFEAPGS
jgi:hypothetical protein